MAIVCQQCGALGYEDLLVYCSLCHQAAEHEYCMDTIPNTNEDIKWSCEDCNRMSDKLSQVTNGQDLKIPNNNIGLLGKPNAFLYQYKGKLLISNNNKMISSEDSSANDLHGAHVSHIGKNRLNLLSLKSHITKAWGKNNKRAIKSNKPTLETYIVPLKNRGTTSQPFQQSKHNGRRRRLVLLDEDDDSTDEIEKDSPLDQSFENDMPTYRRRKLVLPDEEDEQNINLEAALLPERIVSKNNEMKEVGSTMKKTDDEKTIDTDSGGDSMKILSANSTRGDVQLRNVQEFEVLQSEFYFISAMPLRSYSWRGLFEISGRIYGPLTAHLSTKAGEKALNAIKSLPPVIQLTRVSKSHAWPKSFGNSPSDDHIALFFFPLDSGKELTVLYKQGRRDGRSASRRDDQPCCGAKSSVGGGGDANLPLCFVAKRPQDVSRQILSMECFQTQGFRYKFWRKYWNSANKKNSTKEIVHKPSIKDIDEGIFLKGEDEQENLCDLTDEDVDKEISHARGEHCT